MCEADGTGKKQLTDHAGLYADQAPLFTRDDEAVIGVGFPDYEDGSCVMLPYLVKADGTEGTYLEVGMQKDGSEVAVCHGVTPMIAGRTEMGAHAGNMKLSGDGAWLYALSGSRGTTGIYRAELKNPHHTEKVKLPGMKEEDITAFAMNKKGELVWLAADVTHPADVWTEGGRITEANDWLAKRELGEVEEFWTKSRDGEVDLQWFLVHPAGKKADPESPAVLYVKGGPETMYTKTFWHEFQALSGAGFTVIYGNPRGSVGFGRAFCAGAVCWKPEAMNDLLDMVEDAAKRGFLDKKRIGVTGGSYGGYMTNKLLGRTDVFSAAVTQRCLVNPVTSYGTGDMGFISAREVPKTFKMLDYLADRAKGNIITYIDEFNAPLLILHGMKDYRCGFEQAEQIFTAMKERRPEIPVRLVAFPGENHEVSRNGKLYNQIRHLKELVDWFVKYLNKEAKEHE